MEEFEAIELTLGILTHLACHRCRGAVRVTHRMRRKSYSLGRSFLMAFRVFSFTHHTA
jgi:hypothetical protein